MSSIQTFNNTTVVNTGMNWICASCETEQSGERIQHFVSKHWFRPKEQQQQAEAPEGQPFFFHNSFTVSAVCPTCRQTGDMEISHTEKSIRITCPNTECGQVKLYRQVIDRKPVIGEIDVTQ